MATASNSYLCCGTNTNNWNACGAADPWNDFFGNNDETHKAHSVKVQPDWDNPFDLNVVESDPADARSEHMSHAGRSAADTRSVGSGGMSSVGLNSVSYDSQSKTPKYRNSKRQPKQNLDGKSLKDIEREEKARQRAMQLSESLVASRDMKPFGTQGGLKLSSHHTALASANSNDETRLADKANQLLLRKTQSQISQTESTRPKTPDTSTEEFAGMKKPLDLYLEKEAKKKSSLMISNGRWPFNKNSGMAIWSIRETPKKSKGVGVTELV